MRSNELRRDQPAAYQIQMQGWIGDRWVDWFDTMTITIQGDLRDDPPISTLTGVVADQAALLGLLQKLYTLGFPLLLVKHIGS